MTLVSTPSTATKGTVLEMMFEELGAAGYEFDNGPEEQISALRKLDGMMSDWRDIQGIDIGYNFPAVFGEGDPLDPAGIPDSAIQTVAIALGVRYAPSWAKSMSAETRKAFNMGMSTLRAATVPIPEMSRRRGTPVGAGNKWRSVWAPFVVTGEDA